MRPVALLALALGAACSRSGGSDAVGEGGIRIAVRLDTSLPTDTTVAYSSTFQNAWNALIDILPGEPVFSPPWPEGAALNVSSRDRSGASTEGQFVAAGGADAAKRIDAHLAALGRPPLPPLGPLEFVAYAHDLKDLRFATPFEPRPVRFRGAGRKRLVEGFGTGWNSGEEDAKGRAQVRLHHEGKVGSVQEWVVELRTTAPGERLFLGMLLPRSTLGATWLAVRARVVGEGRPIDHQDRLGVPAVAISTTFGVLGAPRRGFVVGGAPGFLSEASQAIDFRLDREGARLEATALIRAGTLSMKRVVPPREIFFDRPFLVAITSSDLAPRFLLWVGNLDPLTPELE